MAILRPQAKKQLELMIYKLLHDMLFLGLFLILGLLLLDSLVPNYFFSPAIFSKILFLFFAVLWLAGWLGRKNKLVTIVIQNKKSTGDKFTIFLFTLSALLVINSFKNLPPIWLVISSAVALFILFYLYRTLALPDE